jgi:hypothetical protein
MDWRDRELLDKQLRNIHTAPRKDGVMVLALLAMFFSGMAVGGFFYAYTGASRQAALNQQTTSNQQVASNNMPIFASRRISRQ